MASHPFFQRRPNHLTDLIVKVPVTVGEAAAGAKIDIPTPHGAVNLHVPPGTSSGAKLRVKGYGVAPKNGTPGDLLAEIQIVLPKRTFRRPTAMPSWKSTSVIPKSREKICTGSGRPENRGYLCHGLISSRDL